ncbi:MAG TPA: sugar transferase [Xanthobacteraceae bacterium]|nr:sugar transferase [Xanthobacteraceae bacterium]
MALVAPLVALYLRNGSLITVGQGEAGVIYCVVSVVFTLTAFAIFRTDGMLPRYLSVFDICRVALAVILAELVTCLVLFSFIRLEGIPRSLPAIHALLLCAGALGVRALTQAVALRRGTANRSSHPSIEHVVLIGVNDPSVLFMRFLEASGGSQRKVVAILDDNPQLFGRSVSGAQIFGPPQHLESLIREFETHGVRVDSVVIGVETDALAPESIAEINRVCGERGLELVVVPEFFTTEHKASGLVRNLRGHATSLPQSRYFRYRRAVDFTVALMCSIAFAPLCLAAAAMTLFDVGMPVTFWQQRLGMSGRAFYLHKIRTLKPAFDRAGQRLPEASRLSVIGRMLRQTRLDELPQLLNVLTGDMALIGPRPLLPQDQPANPAARLAVRPGITGWAQVNGGNLLSATEKNDLDRWYIANASLWLDLKIVFMTGLSLIRGDRRSEAVLARARHDLEQLQHTARDEVIVTSRFTGGRSAEEDGKQTISSSA